MLNSLFVFLFTIGLIVLVDRVKAAVEKEQKRKYWREYAKEYRARKKAEKESQIQDWRKTPIRVNDYLLGTYYIKR